MTDKPNILLITTDHLRYDTLGCNGDLAIQTPAIDRLASESTIFDSYFVQNPVCMPSRASLMTGRYPRHHGVRWNFDELGRHEMTMAEYFKQAGYRTASIGKHHISQKRFLDALDHEEASGIRRNWAKQTDRNYAVEVRNPFEQYVHARGYEYRTGFALPNFRENLGAVPSGLPEDCHLDAYVGMRCREYLCGLDPDLPFFLWLGFYGPHHPYVPSGRFATMYDPQKVPGFQKSDRDISKKPVDYQLYIEAPDHKFRGFANASEETFRRMKAAYYGMVSQIDWQIGLTLDLLEKKGLAENTIVVFTSDHGEFLGDHGIPAKAPFLLDCMLHVPFFIRIPHRSGRRSDELVESVDVFPTLARLAELTPPEWVQGLDLSPFLSSSTGRFRSRQNVYAEAVDKKCIRTKNWKYIHYPNRECGELYDLRADPYELNNLFVEERDRALEMREALFRLLDATEDSRHPGYRRFGGTDPDTGAEITHFHTW